MKIVFAPTHCGKNGHRLQQMEKYSAKDNIPSWTCQKTAEPGDLYVFYFAAPKAEICALGVADGEISEEENDGWDWTNSKKGWFCAFTPVIWLKHPLSADEIKRHSKLSRWWDKKPYRGIPKTVPPDVAKVLLSAISKQSRGISNFLSKHHAIAKELDGLDLASQLTDNDHAPPEKVETTVQRIVRDTAKGRSLRSKYDDTCQLCGVQIAIPGGFYAEVHHVRPLGRPCTGPDTFDNMLVLCPTCHLEFDKMAIGIRPKDLVVVDLTGARRGKLHFRREHALDGDILQYQWNRFIKVTLAK